MAKHQVRSTRSRILAVLITAALLVLVLLSLGIHTPLAWWYPLELFTSFRVQYLILSAIAAGVLALLWATNYLKIRVLAIAALVIVGLNAVDVIPWYLPHPLQTAATSKLKTIRVLSFNLNTQNDRYTEVVKVVREERPDLALFIEVNQAATNSLKAGFGDDFPYSFRSPGGGLALFSRLPIRDARGDNFNGAGNHNLIATIEVERHLIQFIGTHPFVPIKRSTFQRRNLQIAALEKFVRGLSQPTILAGDLNVTPWSPYYRHFISETKLHNTRLGYGILPSWPRPATHVHFPHWIIPFVNIPIDHCLVSKDFKVANIYTGANANSDHASLVTDLILNVDR
ncbi:MAG: endonuclease/exonuclease/phosphatase family protein [Cyanosarcina radialis HA8281-LM2]|jgi:endonuclease/exonuclease/phosphatase (EEP) superfamily protein YafD|nr:endonuclease/exonuclease/phosphatase family protein [Cyanosarcina radialis HA8281-LM2]